MQLFRLLCVKCSGKTNLLQAYRIWDSHNSEYEEFCLLEQCRAVNWKSTNTSEEYVACVFRVKQAVLATSFHTGSLLGLFFWNVDFNRLHGVISQKSELFVADLYTILNVKPY
jgi:hypothetical protein